MKINGAKVKAAREKAQKKVAMLAVEIDMSAPWVYALEKSKEPVEVKDPIAHAIARKVGVKISEIVAG